MTSLASIQIWHEQNSTIQIRVFGHHKQIDIHSFVSLHIFFFFFFEPPEANDEALRLL